VCSQHFRSRPECDPRGGDTSLIRPIRRFQGLSELRAVSRVGLRGETIKIIGYLAKCAAYARPALQRQDGLAERITPNRAEFLVRQPAGGEIEPPKRLGPLASLLKQFAH
jgi:hypothetical protein